MDTTEYGGIDMPTELAEAAIYTRPRYDDMMGIAVTLADAMKQFELDKFLKSFEAAEYAANAGQEEAAVTVGDPMFEVNKDFVVAVSKFMDDIAQVYEKRELVIAEQAGEA